MKRLSSLRTLLEFVLRRTRVEREMEEELRSHLQIRADDLERRGYSRAEAERRARLEFGGYEGYKEACREALGSRLLAELAADVRYGLRQLRRSPGFAAVAVLTLALGIGANTAIFSVVNGVLLRPLPYRAPAQLVNVWSTNLTSRTSQMPASYPDFLDWRAQNHVFESIAAHNYATFTLAGPKEPAHVEGRVVSASLFSVLGVKPALGRSFLPEEDQPGHHVVVLSHDLWQGRFNADPAVLGRNIRLDTSSVTVVGVMPPGFQFPIQATPVEVWVAQGIFPQVPNGRGDHSIEVIARLRPQTTLGQAQAEMATIAARLAEQYPSFNRNLGVKLVPAYNQLVSGVRPAVLVLSGAVLMVLLIACANVANLLLARGTNRSREMAIRAAIGAGRRRIMRQLLTESLLLALMGGALGTLLALGAIRLTTRLGPRDIPRLSEISLDSHVLLFSLALSLLTGLIFSLAPALGATHVHLIQSLKTGGEIRRGGSRRHGLRSALIVSEVALTLLLLVGAGLMVNSLFRLTRIDPGFKPSGVLTFAVDLSDAEYNEAQAATRFGELLERIRQTPGMRTAAADTSLPLSEIENMWVGFQIEGQAGPDWPSAALSIVTTDFFRTLDIPLLKGREFTALDNLKAPPVVIVSQSLARKYFPGQDALGKRIKTGINLGNEAPLRQIIAVVGDIRRDSLANEPSPTLYLPESQLPFGSMRVVIRSTASLEATAEAMRVAVRSVDRDLPVYDMKTLDQYLGLAVAEPRFHTLVLGLFATLAALLSAVGLYGVISYLVGQRRHEFGVRMALGAVRADLIAMVLREGLSLVLIGIGIGLLAALGLTRFLSSQLYGVKSTDPLTFFAVAAMFAGIASVANYLPARRATKVHPMTALREE